MAAEDPAAAKRSSKLLADRFPVQLAAMTQVARMVPGNPQDPDSAILCTTRVEGQGYSRDSTGRY